MAFWTQEHEELLVRLYKQGLTGSEIADEINEQLGGLPRHKGPRKINREMALAKIRRMGLCDRGTNVPRVKKKA